ncbi:hypothetical protein GN956_G18000 [Arapaima gigas]
MSMSSGVCISQPLRVQARTGLYLVLPQSGTPAPFAGRRGDRRAVKSCMNTDACGQSPRWSALMRRPSSSSSAARAHRPSVSAQK